jgi:hypothetical protein
VTPHPLIGGLLLLLFVVLGLLNLLGRISRRTMVNAWLIIAGTTALAVVIVDVAVSL